MAVGIYILRKTGSRLIVNLLYKLGVSASYNAINVYESSIVIDPPNKIVEDTIIQFVFDNTDHNMNTLDSRETFHLLGGIYTPES